MRESVRAREESSESITQIDSKSFEFSFQKIGNHDGFKIIERGAGGLNFKIIFTATIGEWISTTMRRVVRSSSINGEKWPVKEGNFSFTIEKLKNQRGEFIKVQRTNINRSTKKSLFIPKGNNQYGWLRFLELLDKLLRKSEVRHQYIPTEKDFPDNNQSKTNHRSQRTFSCVANGSISWNQVAREIATKLNWGRYLKINVINDSLATFQPNNDWEWNSCWKPIKWSFKDTTMEVQRWISEDVTINARSVYSAQNWIKIKGLRVQLWSKENFDKIGAQMGGLAEVDQETAGKNPSYCRLRVKFQATEIPATIQIELNGTTWILAVEWNYDYVPAQKATIKAYRQTLQQMEKRQTSVRIQN